jgi:tetratricopeptide (TPR) repeat protein
MAVLGRATVELWLGQLGAAEASAQQALAVLRAIGDATWTSAALAILAEIERTRGRLEPAGQHAAEAIEIAGRANSAINVMIGTGHLGRILLARGEPGAAQHLDQAVQLARAFAVRPLLAWWLDSLGELAEHQGRYGDARGWYEQAADHAAECGLPVDAARVRHHLARLAWLRGDRASAVNSCHEALAGQLEAGDHLGLVETLETLGGLLIDEGHARRGLPLLAAAAAAREGLGFPPGRWMPTGSRAGSRPGASTSASRPRPRGNAVPGLASRRLARWPGGGGGRAGGRRSAGPA